MNRLGLALLLAPALLTSGCLMAVRHVAKAVNRSGAESHARHEFPVGTAYDDIRQKMIDRGYRCFDLPQADPHAFRMLCRVADPHRTAGTFLVGGNWRFEFFGVDDRLTRVDALKPRRTGTAKKPASYSPKEPESDPE